MMSTSLQTLIQVKEVARALGWSYGWIFWL